MDIHGPEDFERPVPTLPEGVAVCDGIPREKWNHKPVTLTNEAGEDVARAVCQSVDVDLVIDMDGEPLGDDRVAVQIAQSLREDEVPTGWMWSMHSWHIKYVFFNGVSLYDHHETHKYNSAMAALNRRPRSGVRSYDTSRERTERDTPPKKEGLLTTQAIAAVASVICCSNNCLQPFPRGQIQAIRSEIHVRGGVYTRKKCLLDVHGQVHKDSAGKDWITLSGRNVCPTAWWTIHGISKATFYRYKEMYKEGKRAEEHGNLGSKKPRLHTLQATATLRMLVLANADKMPHKSRTLPSGEKVPAMVLPSSFRWSDQMAQINETNYVLDLQPISSSGLSIIRRNSFPEFAPKARGDSFARCGMCDTYKQLRGACIPNSDAYDKWCQILDTHNAGQKAHRELYYSNRHISEMYPMQMLTIIHDKMDHSKTASPHYSHKTKATDSYMKMPVAVTGMIAHGHGDVRYAHYGIDIFPTDSNHTIGSIAKLLRDLEEPPKNSSQKLFSEKEGRSKLSKALLDGAEMCLDSLLPPTAELIGNQPLPPVLTLQLDNASGDNKNRYVFAFCSLLVYHGIFREVYINFLIVGHTHEDIDALFGRWSTKLKTNSYPTLPKLMKSFMDCETHPVIPHFIEEVPDFKKYVRGYLGTGGDYLEGHSQGQQFKFHKASDGWPLMEYKNLCTDLNWKPAHGNGIRLWSETEDGLPKVPTGSPPPLIPEEMRSFGEIKRGLDGYIAYWGRMSNDEDAGEFRRKIDPIRKYWKDVRAAMDEPLEVHQELKHGFWPKSSIATIEADRRRSNGQLREEVAEDEAFIGRRKDRPLPSFRIDRDVFAGYFVAVRPADGDPRPFWLARAITGPSPDPGHVHMIQIQYWTPVSSEHINIETYVGWDTKKGNSWREDTIICPSWSNTDCIMTGWKPRFREGTENPRCTIPALQIKIINASVAAFMAE